MKINKELVRYPRSWKDVAAYIVGALCLVPFIALADLGFTSLGLNF